MQRIKATPERGRSDWPVGGGEVGERIRTADWSRSPLGPIAAWPQCLRTVLGLCLESPDPAVVWWGPWSLMLYNDAWRPMLGGGKHPLALGSEGRQIWPELWDIIGATLEGVLARGEAARTHDQLFFLDRGEQGQACYFTLSHSPIRDETGAVRGVLTTATNSTRRVVAEGCLARLHELAAVTADANEVDAACAAATNVLAGDDNADHQPFALIYLLDDDGHTGRLAGIAGQAPPSLDRIDLEVRQPMAWPLAEAVSGRSILIDDLRSRFDSSPGRPLDDIPQAALVLPMSSSGEKRPTGFLIAGLRSRHVLDEAYRAYLELVASQLGSAIANLRARCDRKLGKVNMDGICARTDTEEQLRLAQTYGGVGVWSWDVLDGVLNWEPELEKVYGLDPGTIHTYQDWASRVHPDDLPRIEAERDAALARQEPFYCEFRIRHPTGAQRWIAAKGRGEYDGAGHLRRILGVNIDVTESKRAEESLRLAHERLARAQRGAGVGVWDWDIRTGKIDWSPELYRLFGLDPDKTAACLETWRSILHPEDLQAAEERIDAAVRNRTQFRSEDRIVLPTGEVRWVKALGDTRYDENGQPLQMAGICLDITDWKLAERALSDLQEERRLILDSVPAMIWYKDTENRILRLNQLAAQSLGLSKEQVEGHHTSEFYPDEADRYHRDDLVVVQSGLPRLGIEEPYSLPSGEKRWIRTDKVPLKDASGRVTRILVMAVDITEHKRAEEELFETQQKLQAIMQAVPVGICFSSDPSCRHITGNPAVLSQFEMQPEDNLSASAPDDTAPGRQLRFFHDGRELTDAELPLQRAVAEKRVIPPMELEVALPSGHRWCVEVSGAPLLDRHGEVTSGVAVVVDITDRKRSDNALRESEERLRFFIEYAPVALAMFDRQMRYLYASHRWRKDYGLGDRELLGVSHYEVFPEIPEIWKEAHRHGLAGEVLRADADRFERADGSVQWVRWEIRPWFAVAGKQGGIVIFAEDVTDRKVAEVQLNEQAERLREADRRKDEFLATLAHELRNPLAPLRNALHLLRMSDRQEPAGLYEIMERQVGHMVRLVDELLEVSRITRGKIELKREMAALTAIIDSAVEISRPVIEAGRHRLTISLPPEPLTLNADPVRLSQVFTNLLNNAAKYTEAGGQICLTAQREGDEAVVSVRDTGIGIPAALLPRVFDLFTQLDPGTDRIQSGLGIGLALARSLVQMHDGRLEARSEGPGQGSEFVVRLPLAPSRPADAAVPKAPKDGLDSKPRVLVVDDNTDAADSLGMLLDALGAEAHVVYDGRVALESLDTFEPAFVVLDLSMPGMDGFEVARRIRQHPRFRDVTLIALTGWGQEDARLRSRAAGFDHHLTKPVNVDALREILGSPAT